MNTTTPMFAAGQAADQRYFVMKDGQVILQDLYTLQEAIPLIKKQFGIDLEIKDFLFDRFLIGETYVFMMESFQRKNPYFGRTYFPWEDKLNKVHFVVLECVSKHDVPGEWDDEIKYKGYKFKLVNSSLDFLVKDSVWHNQFPRASYGQVTTDSDWYASPHVEGQGAMHALLDKMREAQLGFGNFEEAGMLIARMHRGIYQIQQEAAKPDFIDDEVTAVDKVKSLKSHLEFLDKELAGLGFKAVTHTVRFWDSKTQTYDSLDGHYETYIVRNLAIA